MSTPESSRTSPESAAPERLGLLPGEAVTLFSPDGDSDDRSVKIRLGSGDPDSSDAVEFTVYALDPPPVATAGGEESPSFVVVQRTDRELGFAYITKKGMISLGTRGAAAKGKGFKYPKTALEQYVSLKDTGSGLEVMAKGDTVWLENGGGSRTTEEAHDDARDAERMSNAERARRVLSGRELIGLKVREGWKGFVDKLLRRTEGLSAEKSRAAVAETASEVQQRKVDEAQRAVDEYALKAKDPIIQLRRREHGSLARKLKREKAKQEKQNKKREARLAKGKKDKEKRTFGRLDPEGYAKQLLEKRYRKIGRRTMDKARKQDGLKWFERRRAAKAQKDKKIQAVGARVVDQKIIEGDEWLAQNPYRRAQGSYERLKRESAELGRTIDEALQDVTTGSREIVGSRKRIRTLEIKDREYSAKRARMEANPIAPTDYSSVDHMMLRDELEEARKQLVVATEKVARAQKEADEADTRRVSGVEELYVAERLIEAMREYRDARVAKIGLRRRANEAALQKAIDGVYQTGLTA